MQIKRVTPDNVQSLEDNQIFVFGSNMAGIHGKGAAKLAADKFGAEDGIGIGMSGQCYAIPTKNYQIKTLPLSDIENYITEFINVASNQEDNIFLVTKIGCGLAGYNVSDIAPYFYLAKKVENIWLPKEFWEWMMLWDYANGIIHSD